MSRTQRRIAMPRTAMSQLNRDRFHYPLRAVALIVGLLCCRVSAGENGWTTTGPDVVVNLVTADEDRQRLYAASDQGIYERAIDDTIWAALAGGALADHNVLSFAVGDGDGRLYAGTDRGLFVSADAGTTWTQSVEPGSGIMSLAAGGVAGRVYAGTFGRGVFTSNDGGATWIQSDVVDAIVYDIAPAFDGQTVYAASARGLLVSRDVGLTWAAPSDELATTSVRTIHLPPAIDAGTVTIGTYGRGVLQSQDGGVTWAELNGSGDRVLTPLQVRSLVVDDANPNVMFAATSTGGFQRTTDRGDTWLAVNTGLAQLTGRDVAMLFDDRNRITGTGTGHGVWEIRFADTPQIELGPQSLEFGPVPIGSRQYQTIEIGNSGTADLIVRSVRMGGSSGFSVALPGGVALPDSFLIVSGNSTFVEITFEPAVRDLLLRDEVRFTSDDPDEPERSISVMGRGTQAVLAVHPSRVDFGAIQMSSAQIADTTLTLTNTGSASLRLLGASFDNSRYRVLDFAPTTLTPGQGTTMRISFDPLVPRSETGSLILISESLEATPATTDTLRLTVTGTGTAPDIDVSTAILDFGRVDVGREVRLPLEVANTGTAPLTITRLVTRGDQFQIDRTLGVPRDTVFTVPAQDTILVVAGDDTTIAIDTGVSTQVEVRGDTTLLVTGSDTTRIVSGADTTMIIVGGARTVVAAAEDSTILAPDSTFVFEITYRPTRSGALADTLDIFSDAPIRFGQLSVLLRGEGNSLSLEPTPPIHLGVYPVDLVVTQLDAVDGVDIAIIDSVTGRLHVLANDGGGEFPVSLRTTLPDDGAPYYAWSEPVTIDAGPIYNMTGPADLVIGDRVARSLSILANDGQGRFSGRRDDIYIGHHISDLVVVDLDADADRDIAVANGPTSDTITLLYNDGQGNFSARAVLGAQAGASHIVAGHLDADGYVDLAVANRSANTVSVYLNDRNGSFAGAVHYLVGVAPGELSLADMDADGHLDISVASSSSRAINLLRNTGTGSFISFPAQTTGLQPSALAAAGLTADVFADLVAGGHGDFLVFLENKDGANFERQDIEIGFPIRQVRVADIDANGVGDIIAISADSARLQLLRNRLVGRQVPPRAPAAVIARDVTRDLGGRIAVEWQDGDYGHQPPAQQIIPTTAYTVVRSTSIEFAVSETLAVVPGGTFSFDDAGATPYSTFFYQVIAERDGLRSAPSAPASATSLPAPLVDVKLTNAPRVSRGDTLVAQVYVTPAQHDVAGISVFMTFEPTALQLLPSPADTTRPFRVAPDLAGSFTTAINGYHNGLNDSTGKVDLTLISTVPGGVTPLTASVEPVLVAELWFLASAEASTFLSVDDESATNRRTAIVEAGSGLWIEPVFGDTTRLAIRDVFVSGQVQVQQRGSTAIDGDLATLLFIDSISNDTLRSALNDEDRLQPGIQVSLDNQGRFFLDQIPVGNYQVFAKVATHLQGIVVGDTVTVDSSRRDLSFRWVAPDTSSVALLPAGDANDDNRINLADFGVLVRHYGATQATSDWAVARQTDFNGDDRVDFDDFLLLADNFGRIGMQVSSAARPMVASGHVWLEDGMLKGEGIGPIRGITLLLPATADVSFEHTLFAGTQYEFRTWSQTGGRQRLALILSGMATLDADGPLLRLDDATMDRASAVEEIEVLGVDGHSRRIHLGSSTPVSTALGANYPNPFNPTTTIPFDLNVGSKVRLEIFDVLGQQVRVLLSNESLSAGRYQIVWEGRDEAGRDVASGHYFYQLRVGGGVQSRRLLLLR
ncbi:MAG: choice-of-anchor D domain-containing protein [Gemmatimonadetes bacterium]|nr:choice-of-anchor D domain-containing protein [Gemmatimonadota bacterium]